MATVTISENQLRNTVPDLATRLEVEILAAALAADAPLPLRCWILAREWQAAPGRVAIQIGDQGWMAHFSVPREARPGEVRDAVLRIIAGRMPARSLLG